MYRIGCDVGGTNTDAVVIDTLQFDSDTKGVLATCKTPTTANVTDGIRAAIQDVLLKSQVDTSLVTNVAIGTTHFVNAVIENDTSRLEKVACIRLCGPYTRMNPPFSDFPYALRDTIEGPIFYLDGGLEIDGRQIKPLDIEQISRATEQIYLSGIRAVALVGIFSALDHEGLHEEKCKKHMLDMYPDMKIVTSHKIGGPGLLTRENATILNAAISSFASKTIDGFHSAMESLGLSCPLFLTQNDGTLIDAASAAQLPIKMFSSGPTNSLIGASFLQGQDRIASQSDTQVLVVDIGGTTTDICALLPSGFPRKAANFVQVGGVRTAFSMPEVHSIGLGGGSRVRITVDGHVVIGPDSVGYSLKEEALVFGGSTLTTADIIVAAGLSNLGDSEKVKSIPHEVVDQALSEIRNMLESAIDKMKVSVSPVLVLLVGGGSIIFPNGMSMQHTKPKYHDSANAIGAAIAKIAGEIDVIEILAGKNEEIVLRNAKQKAIAVAVAGGADENYIEISEMSKIPLQYINNKATRLVIKAVGPLKQRPSEKRALSPRRKSNAEPLRTAIKTTIPKAHNTVRKGSMAYPCTDVDLSNYRPDVRNGVWHISAVDVELCAVGCGILGTGGGGSPYNMALHVFDILRQKGQGAITVVSLDSLKDDDVCVFGSGYGAPSVSDERVGSGDEIPATIEQLNRLLGHTDFQGIVAAEIGGGNGIVTFPTSARFGRPVVDCDLMGRAYPTVEHCTPYVYGHSVTPVAMADAKENVSIVVRAENNTKLEGMLRTTCIELGNAVGVTGKPLSGKVIKDLAIPNTLSQAWFLGRAVYLARQEKIDIISAISAVTPVRLLFTGKVIDVSRDVSRGYTVGKCVITPELPSKRVIGDGESVKEIGDSHNLLIEFQNEYLIAYHEGEGAGSNKDVLCVVPDLISILGSNGEALGSSDLRYGLQVKVVAMPAHPIWTQSERAMKIGGPEFFNLGVPWKPIGEYRCPKSVIEQYNRML